MGEAVATDALSGVEPRHLATLAAVGEAGSFKAAAQHLGYAHSAVSQRIAQLERVLGRQLVARVPGHATVALTEAGSVVVQHARGILGQLDAAVADLRAQERGDPLLRVGVHDPAAMRTFSRALHRLAARDPQMRLAICDGRRTAVARARDVRRGLLDVALEDLPLPPGPFACFELLRDPIVLVTPRDAGPAARGELASLAELEGVPLVADASWPLLGVITAQLEAAGVQPRFALQSQLGSSVQALVGAGVGAALMPALSVDERDPRIAVTRLGALLPPRRIGLYWHAQRRRVEPLERFRDALLAACAELAPVVGGAG